MAKQCYAYAREKWDSAYPTKKLVSDSKIISGPTLWAAASKQGYNTSSKKAVAKSIVCWDDGGNGHVAWVRSVNEDGSMNISESNWPIGQDPIDRDSIAFGKRGQTVSMTLLGCVYPK